MSNDAFKIVEMKANRVTFAAANVYISDVPPKDFIQPVSLEHPHVSRIQLDALSPQGKRPRCLQAPASRGKHSVSWSSLYITLKFSVDYRWSRHEIRFPGIFYAFGM